MIGAYPFRIGDELRVSVRSSTTTDVILFARVRYDDGTDDLIELNITHSSGDRSNQIKRSADLFKKAGWVEHLTIDTSLNDARGQFYMMVAINKEPHHFPIAAGYIDIPHVPLGEFESARHGRGFMRSIDLGDPAAGAEYADQTVPTNALWKVLGFNGILVAAATAGDRRLKIEYTDGTDTVVGAASHDSVENGETHEFYASIGGSRSANGDGLTDLPIAFALPDVYILEGYVVTFDTTDQNANDDWGDGQLYVEEWIAP